MHVIHGTDFVPAFARGAALAIGNFDGVHRGHQALIRTALDTARALGRPSGVMVFEPHPRAYFAPAEPHFPLTPLPEKLRVLDSLGLKIAVVLPFDRSLAALPAGEFIDDILVRGLGVSHVVIGYDFFFGSKRGGNPATMAAAAGAAAGFAVLTSGLAATFLAGSLFGAPSKSRPVIDSSCSMVPAKSTDSAKSSKRLSEPDATHAPSTSKITAATT